MIILACIFVLRKVTDRYSLRSAQESIKELKDLVGTEEYNNINETYQELIMIK